MRLAEYFVELMQCGYRSVAERTILCEQLTNLLVNKMPRTKESTPAEQESARSSEVTDAYQKVH